MRRDAPRIGVEVLLLSMILAVLGGALALVIQAHCRVPVPGRARRAARGPEDAGPADRVATATTSAAACRSDARTASADPRPPGRREGSRRRREPRAAGLDEARQRAEAETRRILDQVEKAQAEAIALDAATSSSEEARDYLARERDVLVEKRDDAKAALERQRLRSRDGVAVLPYKGPNGTWRRPIAIECRGDRATLQPGGPSFTMTDMTSFPNPRRSPLVFAVAKAMLRARSVHTPDGAASVPYLMFIVRPDGVRPYYAAQDPARTARHRLRLRAGRRQLGHRVPRPRRPGRMDRDPGLEAQLDLAATGRRAFVGRRPGGESGSRRAGGRFAVGRPCRRLAGRQRRGQPPGARATFERHGPFRDARPRSGTWSRLRRLGLRRWWRARAEGRRARGACAGRIGRRLMARRRDGLGQERLGRRLAGRGGAGEAREGRSRGAADPERRSSPLATGPLGDADGPRVPAHAAIGR